MAPFVLLPMIRRYKSSSHLSLADLSFHSNYNVIFMCIVIHKLFFSRYLQWECFYNNVVRVHVVESIMCEGRYLHLSNATTSVGVSNDKYIDADVEVDLEKYPGES